MKLEKSGVRGHVGVRWGRADVIKELVIYCEIKKSQGGDGRIM